jgi:hypothetical protein
MTADELATVVGTTAAHELESALKSHQALPGATE